MQGKINSKIRVSLKAQKAIYGYLFVFPFIIGFFSFYLYPFIQSFIFSVSELKITKSGFNLDFVGLSNFYEAFLVDPEFNRELFESFIMILADIPAIIIFSFFAAVLLNQNFRGRLVARVIFFLPIILNSGVLIQMEGNDLIHQAFAIGTEEGFFGAETVENLLWQMQLPESFIEYIVNAVAQVPEIINLSAIPIIIFLAGLQSIPKSLYETARIEGANSWDSFWKVTFPILTPLILTNLIFIIIYSFTYVNNPVITYIEQAAWLGGSYGVSTAMAWIYFLMVMIILAIVGGFFSKKVFYMN